MGFSKPLVLLALVVAALRPCFADDRPQVAAGTEVSFPWGPEGGAIPIYVPENYTPERRWPAVFFYHGLNGVPSTSFFRRLSGGRDVVIVGMEYLERGLGRRTADEHADYQGREREQLAAVRRNVLSSLSVDSDRLYLAGISKGGWQVSQFAERGFRGFAGAVILIAGRFPNGRTGTPSLKGKPIYIGAGEKDGNNIYARMAGQYFEKSGAIVTWEEFPGKGHQVDADAPLLNAWVGAHLLATDKTRREDARVWLKAQRARYEASEGDSERHDVLRDILADPRLRLCRDRDRRGVEAQSVRDSELPSARRRLQAEALFRKALWREQTAKSLRHLEEALEGYRRAAADFPKTVFGRLARREVERVQGHVEEARARIRIRARIFH